MIPMLACEYTAMRGIGVVWLWVRRVTPRRDEALTPRPTRLRWPLTRVQLRAVAGCTLAAEKSTNEFRVFSIIF